jgi:hypothetical protein
LITDFRLGTYQYSASSIIAVFDNAQFLQKLANEMMSEQIPAHQKKGMAKVPYEPATIDK